MNQITPDDKEAQTATPLEENLEKLKQILPGAFTDGKVDFDAVRELLGDAVEDSEEKYGVNWHGKRRARQLALTPSTGTLRPAPEDSVDWDTTQNLMIEGDNLEVLKLLQKPYAGKVKLIYIDPPYNTGKDFVYPDNYTDSIRNYLEITGQVDEEGKKISTNAESSGRFHTDWLNMMYPRLMLARSLLREDGVICASIDDGELTNLRAVFDEVFGNENFVVQLIWRKRSTPPNDKIVGTNHDYVLCYARSLDAVGLRLRERSQDQTSRYQNPDDHPKGPWAPGDLMANVKGGRYVESLHFPIVNPNTDEKHLPGKRGNWRFSKKTIEELMANDEIYFGADGKGKPKLKRFLADLREGVTYPSIWDFVPLNTQGSAEMELLFGEATVFENPKPVGLIQELIRMGMSEDDIALDFFAGSGTTGHAAMAQNAADGGRRKYMVVQLPEHLDADAKSQNVAAEMADELAKPRNIAELTKERLRRAGKKVKEDSPNWEGDAGFRVFRLDSSNIRAWDPQPDELEQTLEDSIEHLKADRSEQDILYELLIKLGLDLCVPIETKELAGSEVHSIGAGTLFACLATEIDRESAEKLGEEIANWKAELDPAGDTTCVFRDSAFVDDVAKANLKAILEQHGVAATRSL